jgi:hypothetical protein
MCAAMTRPRFFDELYAAFSWLCCLRDEHTFYRSPSPYTRRNDIKFKMHEYRKSGKVRVIRPLSSQNNRCGWGSFELFVKENVENLYEALPADVISLRES